MILQTTACSICYNRTYKQLYRQILAEGIILPVSLSDWEAPVVPVVKSDKKIRFVVITI